MFYVSKVFRRNLITTPEDLQMPCLTTVSTYHLMCQRFLRYSPWDKVWYYDCIEYALLELENLWKDIWIKQVFMFVEISVWDKETPMLSWLLLHRIIFSFCPLKVPWTFTIRETAFFRKYKDKLLDKDKLLFISLTKWNTHSSAFHHCHSSCLHI